MVIIDGVVSNKITDVYIAPQQPNGPRSNVVYEGKLIGDVSEIELGKPFDLEFNGKKYLVCRLINTPSVGSFKYLRIG
jgi:hypothetical protein